MYLSLVSLYPHNNNNKKWVEKRTKIIKKNITRQKNYLPVKTENSNRSCTYVSTGNGAQNLIKEKEIDKERKSDKKLINRCKYGQNVRGSLTEIGEKSDWQLSR